MTLCRFLDATGDVVAEREFAERALALDWAEDDADDEGVQRVESLGPEGDRRWAGALKGEPRVRRTPAAAGSGAHRTAGGRASAQVRGY